jgi:acyl-CoA synthetase (AMP-forming)/AMP-acid ligase II
MTEAREMRPPEALTNRELWRWRVDATPDRRFLQYEGRSWTYGEFDMLVRSMAAGLRGLGIEQGTRVLVGMSNRPEALQTHFALAHLGAVCVPLVPGMPFDEMRYPMRHSEATFLVSDDPIASSVAEHREACDWLQTIVVLDAELPGALPFAEVAGAEPLEHAPLPGGDDPDANGHIVYTSGSTGRPKGVMLRSASLYHCGLGYADLYCFDSDDTYILPLTLAHSLGCIAATGIPIVTGGSLAMTERFRPSTFFEQVAETGATISVLFPAHLNLLVEADDGSVAKGSSTLRFVVTHADIPAFRDRFGVELGTIWGMTETLVCVGSDPGHRGEMGPGYVGHVFAGGEVGIFDPATFERVGPYAYGEICVRHEQAMIGYLKDPEATAATVHDGWVRSGDRGFKDSTGRTYFAGRYKAMIKRSGENVSAEEVEAALAAHPDVAECVVVAVPDRLRTEEVGAVVVRRAGAAADPAALRAAAGEQLIRWKLPRFIEVLDESLPRLGNGKIDRVGSAALIDPAVTWDAEKQAAAPN